MREISLYVPETVAQEVLRKLEGSGLAALAAVPTVSPPGHMHVTIVVPDALFSDTLATLRASAALREGILVSRRLEAVEGERVRVLRTRLGAAEAESVVWEEVLQQLEREATPGPAFLLFVVLASVIAVCGLIAGSIPVLIGAMVVPPAISSLMAIAVGGLKRQWGLLFKGVSATLLTLMLSIVTAWVVAGVLAAWQGIPQESSLLSAEIIQERTHVGIYAYLVALAAGIAGGLSAMTDRPSQLVGVMIAAAIVPSAATVGLGLAQWDGDIVLGALRLLASNVGLIVAGGYVATLGLSLHVRLRAFWHDSPRRRAERED